MSEILEKWLNAIAAGGGSHDFGQSPANTEVIFNREELLARLMGDENLAHMVVAGFLNDAPAQLRSLRQKIDKGDADGVRMQAHTLKGASATVSAEALSALCREVQDAAAAKDLIRAATLLRQLEEQFELLKPSWSIPGGRKRPQKELPVPEIQRGPTPCWRTSGSVSKIGQECPQTASGYQINTRK